MHTNPFPPTQDPHKNFDFRSAVGKGGTNGIGGGQVIEFKSTGETAGAMGRIVMDRTNGYYSYETDSYVQLPTWKFHSSFSIEVALSMEGDTHQSIFTAFGNPGATNNPTDSAGFYPNLIFLERVSVALEPHTSHRVRFAVYNHDSANVFNVASVNDVLGFGQNTVGHFIVTFNTTEGVKMYSNEFPNTIPIVALPGSAKGTGVGATIDTTIQRPLHFIGRTYFGDFGKDQCRYFRYYDRSLTQSEVTTLQNEYTNSSP